MKCSYISKVAATAVVFALVLATDVQAGLILVTSRANLGGNDAVVLSGLPLGNVSSLPLPLSTVGGELSSSIILSRRAVKVHIKALK